MVQSVASPDPQAEPSETQGQCEWITALQAGGRGYDDAVLQLRQLVARAARFQVMRMPLVWANLGSVRAEEIIDSAADEATVAVLAHLNSFAGRSKFSTWVFKFGTRCAAAEARRALWRGRTVDLDGQPEPADDHTMTPEAYLEAKDFAAAVSVALQTVLTARQRQVAVALLVDEIPVDVLAERLGTNRNALYKSLHDARVKLRAELRDRDYLPALRLEEVSR